MWRIYSNPDPHEGGNWNVRSMYITGKTAQIDQEMDGYGIDILGLSEARWPMNGKNHTTKWESNAIFQQRGWVTSGRSWNYAVKQGQKVSDGMKTNR
jgi:hypothetical protein